MPGPDSARLEGEGGRSAAAVPGIAALLLLVAATPLPSPVMRPTVGATGAGRKETGMRSPRRVSCAADLPAGRHVRRHRHRAGSAAQDRPDQLAAVAGRQGA